MEEFETFFHELLDLARDTIRPVYFSPDLVVESKADDTPVTFADRETERVLRERIEAKYPQHGIIGEEFGNTREDA